MLKKVISGGQTGVDRLGLDIAKSIGIPTGGTAPRGWRTEKGVDLTLKEYGLVESYSSNYNIRTLQNVQDSSGTVLFGNMNSTGSRTTIELCVAKSKPYVENPTSEQLIKFIEDNHITILNVAGNRGSILSTQHYLQCVDVLTDVFATLLVK